MADRGGWMIYGANGFTGHLVAVEAKRQGLRPVLAGRRAGPIEALAEDLGLPARVFDLGHPGRLRQPSRIWRWCLIAPGRSQPPARK
jgi:short subunit dehydrogenase-like uncharacterized protein